MLGVSLLIGAYNIVYSNFQASNQGQQLGGRMSSMEFFFCLYFLSFFFSKSCKHVVSQQVFGSIKGMELEFYLISFPHKLQFL